ncbi:hypothetical protein OOK41_13725 [Micromonospora sp. NBC_01655]|uniref:hypothetical protein n=1 Tax=Micromonospora sp. NBC_01655 TaxID=2975983 RepID=UPI00224E31A4|nr:hypothetical protein [Micromonospora sp. NBC_01655]MCX4471354.1 hypothetical protein [Micromonospora sp. NBC_01655]
MSTTTHDPARRLSRRGRGLALLAALCVTSALALTGCSTAPETPAAEPSVAAPSDGGGAGAVDKLIRDGLANAKSDFQKEVLTTAKDTGKISEADWKEANNRFKDCLAAKGYQIELIFQGSKVLTQTVAGSGDRSEADKQADAKASQECYEKTSAFINEVYALLAGGGQEKPDGDATQRAVLACLIDRGLVPEDTKYDEFLADLEQGGKQFTPQQGSKNEAAVAKCWVENTQ